MILLQGQKGKFVKRGMKQMNECGFGSISANLPMSCAVNVNVCMECKASSNGNCVQFHVFILLLRDLIAVYRGLVHLVRIVMIVDFVWLTTTKRSNR